MVAPDQVFRDQWGYVLAAQEAFAVAAERWPRDGVPANPGGWLATTARTCAIDHIRRDRMLAAKTRLLEVPEAVEDSVHERTFPKERLELVFTCCHPALATDAQVALSLRTLGGLTTGEIARAFLVPEPTMAQRLGRALAELTPDEPEVHGLLAMMLLLDARREARFRDGDLVLLADQDRALWDGTQIAAGREVLGRALALHGRGAYVVQAAIASLHADEPRDWTEIAALYGELARLTDSRVVELNRAVAVAEVEGPEVGLEIVDRVALEDYRYLHSTRGELLRRLGRTAEARDAYRRALVLVHDAAERRLAELGAEAGSVEQ